MYIKFASRSEEGSFKTEMGKKWRAFAHKESLRVFYHFSLDIEVWNSIHNRKVMELSILSRRKIKIYQSNVRKKKEDAIFFGN